MHEVVRQVMSLCAPPSSIEVAAVLKRSTHAVCKYVCIYACAYPSAVGRFENQRGGRVRIQGLFKEKVLILTKIFGGGLISLPVPPGSDIPVSAYLHAVLPIVLPLGCLRGVRGRNKTF